MSVCVCVCSFMLSELCPAHNFVLLVGFENCLLYIPTLYKSAFMDL